MVLYLDRDVSGQAESSMADSDTIGDLRVELSKVSANTGTAASSISDGIVDFRVELAKMTAVCTGLEAEVTAFETNITEA